METNAGLADVDDLGRPQLVAERDSIRHETSPSLFSTSHWSMHGARPMNLTRVNGAPQLQSRRAREVLAKRP
jgi:hypothetical protein